MSQPPDSRVSDCLFCRIAAGEIPADLVYEDEEVVAFRDIAPQAPCHVLVIPRRHVPSLWELTDPALAGVLLTAAAEIARREGLEEGWRLIGNTRAHGGQEVDHLHLHVLGGRRLGPMLPSAPS
jgi:histidine triad (HIT) family protein